MFEKVISYEQYMKKRGKPMPKGNKYNKIFLEIVHPFRIIEDKNRDS